MGDGGGVGGGVGVGQGEPGGPGNIGGVGPQGMSGAMAGDYGGGEGRGGGLGGPGRGDVNDPRSQPARQRAPEPPPFQINPAQVQGDVNMYPWGGQYQQPIMNPIAYENQMYKNQAPPINWGSFFNLFGGK